MLRDTAHSPLARPLQGRKAPTGGRPSGMPYGKKLPSNPLATSGPWFLTPGRSQGVCGPGLVFLVPLLQERCASDLRIIVFEVPSQDVVFPREHFRSSEVQQSVG